jgi:NitT/TauT family transport system permease protein
MAQTANATPIRRGIAADVRLSENTKIGIASVIGLIVLWALLTSVTHLIPSGILPSPGEMWQTFVTGMTAGYGGVPLYVHAAYSTARVLVGIFLGVITGVPVGLVMGSNPKINAALAPVVSFIRPMPAIAFIPLVILYFGIGEFSKIVVIWVPAFLYMELNTMAGVKSVSTDVILAAKNLGVSRWTLFTKVVIPSAMPFILNGFKTATAVAWAVVIAAELVGAQRGLGYVIMDASTFFRVPYIYIGIMLLGLLGLIMELLIVRMERATLHWVGK